MDLAYDSITKESLPPSSSTPPPPSTAATKEGQTDPNISSSNPDDPTTNTSDPSASSHARTPSSTLNTEIQETIAALSATPWGAKLGGFWSSVRAQGGRVYDEARQEVGEVGGEAVKVGGEAFEGLKGVGGGAVKGFQDFVSGRRRSTSGAEEGQEGAMDGEKGVVGADEGVGEGEGESVVGRFRAEAAKRLKDLEKAEEAADAAIIRFGSNLGNFLKDAVSIAPPSDVTGKGGRSQVLFESKGEDGKRVIHSTRLEAQLYAIHTSQDKFLRDPEIDSEEGKKKWAEWQTSFDIDKRTDDIARDLDRFEELRRMMEQCVPEKVEYKDFWKRYYFLRDIVESEEQRRKEVLKGAAQSDAADEVGWDDDSDEEDKDNNATPQNGDTKKHTPGNASPASLATIQPGDKEGGGLKPHSEGRRSQDEKSQADSDASYDLVSGATSKTPGSPSNKGAAGKGEDEEEDWE